MADFKITRAWTKGMQRAPQFAYGRAPSEWLVEFDGDRMKRRVYKDYTYSKKGQKARLVVIVRGDMVPVTEKEVQFGLSEAKRIHDEWAAQWESK